jgi:glycosyl transferase family 25
MSHLEWINKIFIINLNHAKARWEKCKTQLEKNQIHYERFEAINGKKIPIELKELIHPLCQKILCSKGMQGCALSHLQVLKRILDDKIDTALILEDDFIWSTETTQKIESLKDFRQGIVKLSCIGPFCLDKVKEPTESKFALGNGAYLIRLDHAKSLYSAIQKIYYHIDVQTMIVSKMNEIPIYEFPCILMDGKSDSFINSSGNTLLSKYLPLSDQWKWYMKEPFLAPMGKEINLYLILNLILFVIGLFFRKIWLGKIIITFALADLFYYLVSDQNL